MASAALCSHESSHLGRPAFQASLTHRYARRSPRIRGSSGAMTVHRPEETRVLSLRKCVVYQPCCRKTVSWSSGHSPQRADRPLQRFCSSPRSLGVIASGWRSSNPAFTHTIAGFLSTVGHPSAVALASYCLSSELHLVYCLVVKETGTKYRVLAPHKITPMLGVLHWSGACERFLMASFTLPAQ